MTYWQTFLIELDPRTLFGTPRFSENRFALFNYWSSNLRILRFSSAVQPNPLDAFCRQGSSDPLAPTRCWVDNFFLLPFLSSICLLRSRPQHISATLPSYCISYFSSTEVIWSEKKLFNRCLILIFATLNYWKQLFSIFVYFSIFRCVLFK